MSRFVRASKYRHVFGQQSKKEYNIENAKLTNSAWDTNIISASAKYISINWNASGGGAFAILPLPSPFGGIPNFPHRLPDTLPLARSHTAPVLDTDWSPHNDAIVASGAEDGKVLLWKMDDPSVFTGWGAEGWQPVDFDPVHRIDASVRKVGQVLFHPTAENVLASASGEHVVKLWDLAATDDPRIVLQGHTDTIQSLAFNATGALLATTCRDRKIRLFDPRTGGEPVRITDGHGGIKGSRVVWMGEHERIATTGFSKMSDRQLSVWETGGLGNVKTLTIDQSAGVMMPFWSDNNILFLAGKGDGNIRYYEYESDALHALAEHKSSDPQRGMCFLPRRALSISDCEIARAYKVCGSTIEPIAFIVPRKADSFQSDIYPPAPSSEASLSASEFFSGKTAPRKLVNLDSGVVFNSSAAPTAIPSPSTVPAPISTAAAPAPAPIARAQSLATPVSATPAPETPAEQKKASDPGLPPPFAYASPPAGSASDLNEVAALRDENLKLTAELRESRELIRKLELQLEAVRANARKVAQALVDV